MWHLAPGPEQAMVVCTAGDAAVPLDSCFSVERVKEVDVAQICAIEREQAQLSCAGGSWWEAGDVTHSPVPALLCRVFLKPGIGRASGLGTTA
jgi:hypothetical protein